MGIGVSRYSSSILMTLTDTQTRIKEVCDDVKELLLYKNSKYGDSAISPVRIFNETVHMNRFLYV